MMRIIPKALFNADEFQRIIRFVKAHEEINERDYVDAVNQAGQTY
jgi:hypothetical protein